MQYTAKYINAAGESLTFSLKSGFVLTDFPLLSGLSVNVGTSQSINQVGGTVESQVIDPKVSTIKGFVMGDGTQGKQRLLSVIRPLEMGKIVVNGQYEIAVHITDTPTVSPARMFPRFDFGVIAPYPFWQKTVGTVVPMAGIAGRFHFPWNITKPYKFGDLLSSFFTNVHNTGQVPTPFDLEITALGDAENPTFEDIQTGDMLKINKALTVGERVTVSIKTDGIIATSSKDGDIQGLIDMDSTLFSIRPGDNVIKYTADSGRENLTVQIRFTGKFAGVAV